VDIFLESGGVVHLVNIDSRACKVEIVHFAVISIRAYAEKLFSR
jgi:hypothetical protein